MVVTAGFAAAGVHGVPNIEPPGAGLGVGTADERKDAGAEAAFASAGVRGVGAIGAGLPNTEVVGLVGSPKTLGVGGDVVVVRDGVSGVASLRFPKRLNGAGVAGVGEGDGAGFKIGVAGVGGLEERRVERRGGVFGLDNVLLGFTSSSSLRGTSMGFAITDSGLMTGKGTAVLWASSSSSGSKETGALAKGELRVGRVLGRPRPKGGGEGLVVGTGVDEDFDERDSSLTGVPGGVVLPSRPAKASLDTEDSEGEGEGVTRILGISSCGVVDGERDCGKGMLAGSGGDERWSSSDSSPADLSPSSGTSDRSLPEVYDCPDSSS